MLSVHMVSAHMVSAHMVSVYILSAYMLSVYMLNAHMVSIYIVNVHMLNVHMLNAHCWVCLNYNSVWRWVLSAVLYHIHHLIQLQQRLFRLLLHLTRWGILYRFMYALKEHPTKFCRILLMYVTAI